VLGADLDRRVVDVRSLTGREEELPYDQLIVALGSTSRTLPIPGLAEHALGFKTLAEAIALRNRLVQSLEQAEIEEDEAARRALLTFVFVGAGYAGLEGLAELQDFAADLVERYPRSRLHGLRFLLVEGKDRVMTETRPTSQRSPPPSCAGAGSRC
jgi:NADH:ubiquinone reductase (H+-translocating)